MIDGIRGADLRIGTDPICPRIVRRAAGRRDLPPVLRLRPLVDGRQYVLAVAGEHTHGSGSGGADACAGFVGRSRDAVRGPCVHTVCRIGLGAADLPVPSCRHSPMIGGDGDGAPALCGRCNDASRSVAVGLDHPARLVDGPRRDTGTVRPRPQTLIGPQGTATGESPAMGGDSAAVDCGRYASCGAARDRTRSRSSGHHAAASFVDGCRVAAIRRDVHAATASMPLRFTAAGGLDRAEIAHPEGRVVAFFPPTICVDAFPSTGRPYVGMGVDIQVVPEGQPVP